MHSPVEGLDVMCPPLSLQYWASRSTEERTPQMDII